jgi:hypothetical protein
MRKRILSILLSVCMALTLLPTVALASPVSYGIWVGATEVTSENMDGVIGDGIDGTVTYDASSNTLTLNNATITKTNNYNFAISSEINGSRDLKINLVGSNTITVDALTNTIWGVNAICSYAKVSIKGSEGSSLFVSTPLETTKYKVCIYGKEGVTIEGCAVTATTGNTTGNEKEPCIGINIDSGPLSIKNATVTATAGNTTGYSFGINVSGASSPITIEGSTVTAIGGDGGLGSYGIRYGGSLSIEDSTVIAKTMDTTGIVQALYTALTPAMLGTGVTAQGSTSSDGTGAVTYVPANNATYKWVQIAPASLSQPVISTLAISGSFTAGHNYTVSDLDSYKPAITPNGVTITAEGWQQCVEFGTYSSGWSNWSAGVLSPDTGSTYKLRYYATYSDGTVYSNEVTLNVVGNTTSLALMATPESPQNTGTPITLTATLTGFFPGPGVSGQAIIFKNGGSSCGNAALNAAGVAVFSWTPPGTGTYSLTAEYYGSLYNTAATSAAVSYTIGTSPLPMAAAYATDAAHGTDYVLDSTSKILTIKTDKGAAFWSASDTDYLNYNILLANNVDVSGFKWTPVGNASDPFTGSLDGQGHSITGLTASADSYAGLFSHAVNATIKNLCLSGSVTINNSVDGSYGGALVAYAVKCTIANCCSHTDVTASSSGTASVACAGGLVGIADSATAITNCFNTGNIHAAASDATGSRAYAGGIAGDNYRSNVINCYSIGSVTAATASEIYVGGVVGRSGNNGTATIKNCYYLNGTANKGVGNVWGSVPTITGCGTIGSDKTTLTAGTAAQFEAEQTLASYADNLLNALNGWVNDGASANYNIWKADRTGSPANGGYPLLNVAWSATGSLDLTGVSCNVAAGTITGTTDNMEYSLDDGGTWQDCTAGDTTGLTFATGTVKVRQKDKTANEHTVITIVAPVTSNTPTLGSKTYNSVTLTAMPGYEYSKDGGATWQNSNLFASLSSSTAYSFVARIKATATALPGTVSSALNITTNEAPSGNDGSNGGGSTTPPSTKPTEPVTGSTENKATVDNKGNASVSLTDKNITDAIADAKAEAAKKGVNAGDITAVIHVTTGGKSADTVTVNLPKTTQEQVISNKIASVQLVIDRPDLTIGLDLAAVTEINRQAKADVQLLATRMDNSKLSGDAKAAIGNRPTYDLKATYGSGKSVIDFGKGSVSVEIPYILQKGEIAGNIYAVYVDAKGKVTYLTDSSYDAKRGTVVFSTSHFSTYGVAYKASFNFTDIGGHWAKDDILFVANRGLMTGTSATTFSPGGSMTRGMFVTALGRLASADISAYKQSSFTDVKADAYYMGYIEWGVKNNILVGIGGSKFDPDGLVTREQMAVIMDRYATAIGFKLPEVHAQNVFADNAKIGAWAAPSVKRIQMAGVISGKNGNLFDPQGTATRAEVSAVLHRFVELAIFSDTAQGWTMNDSGKWMYYENGKPVTGKKDIDGAPYTFDQYGVTSDVPKNLRYATYTVQKGDSFWSISRKLDCTMSELEQLNNKSRFSIIHPGDVLRVPEK